MGVAAAAATEVRLTELEGKKEEGKALGEDAEEDQP